MGYSPENNPYIPGDPYSYDLNWIVAEVKHAVELYSPLSQEFSDLHDYVMNYLANLDFPQEVSNKIDQMAADGELDAIILPYFNDYKIEIDREVDEFKDEVRGDISGQDADIAVLKARMDEFASLPPGSTSGNAELLDIRVGANGETYASAGDAVRGQVDIITDAIDGVLSIQTYIASSNVLNANSASGETAGDIANTNYYFGLNKKLSDFTSPSDSLVVYCRTTTDSISGLTAQWLYDDDTTSAGYITLNTAYRLSTVADANRIVGIKFVVYAVGATLVITRMGMKLTNDTSTTGEDDFEIGYASDRLDGIDGEISSLKTYVYDPANVIALSTAAGILSIGNALNTSSPNFMRAIGYVTPGASYQIRGRSFSSSYPVFLWLDANDFIISYGSTAPTSTPITETAIAPANALKIVINYFNGADNPRAIEGTNVSTQEYIDDRISESEKKFWAGKKIVWFGTSIPAGVINNGDQEGEGSYPSRIGEMLGATVYNESIGGSAVRAGDEHAITAEDPMGYGGMSAPGLMLSLSLSSSEKEDIFNDWNDKWQYIITYNQNLINVSDPIYRNMYKNASWDILLNKYLTGGAVGQCDLYVFDHGFNEGVRNYGYEDLSTVPAVKDDRSYFLGAMTFLIDKILADNPNAHICFIGHWSDDVGSGNNSTSLVAAAQEKLAEIWKFQLCETWKKIGWSSNIITSNGVTKPVYQFWCIDGVHPASDLTGAALQHYAETIYPFMRDVR